jgi:hypothetical protein
VEPKWLFPPRLTLKLAVLRNGVCLACSELSSESWERSPGGSSAVMLNVWSNIRGSGMNEPGRREGVELSKRDISRCDARVAGRLYNRY